MTLSDRIRAAALGPAPESHEPWLSDWLDSDEFICAIVALGGSKQFIDCKDETLQRMALLFVAEAVK